jgi:hypothetical protein
LTGYSKSLDHPFKLINEKSHFIFSDEIIENHKEIKHEHNIMDTINYDITKRETLVYLLEL